MNRNGWKECLKEQVKSMDEYAEMLYDKESRKMEYRYHMRLRVYRSEKDFGPGVAVLMELVREKGSLSAACKEMNMAYSKAWKIIQRAERDLGFSLMEGSRGGEHGGRTVLTQQGESFLSRYRAFEREAGEAVDAIFRRYFEGDS